ncbi:hypothetical protein N9430_02470 [Candidatus Pelagibacter sp.]|nr:hypothetical protein [Candidatus Pelagibacter sp.]MDC0924829.1 hypothetical protein [Candidatus Pelagibacter sp.]MDC3288365.1 hypothetical protein [Candidatus Pelagibacter sp.]
MKFKKIYFLCVVFFFLSGCIQSTALLGPSFTLATTGNVMHAGLQYGANTAIKNETGKDALTHLKDAMDEEKDSQNIKTIIKNTIDKISKKLTTN